MPEAPQSIASRKRPWGALAALLFLGTSTAAVYWLSSNGNELVWPGQELTVDAKYLDFGEALETNAFPWKLLIHNPTDKDMKVVGFYTDCSCAGVTPSSFTIPAGADSEVLVSLDLRDYTAKKNADGIAEIPPALRSFAVAISPKIDGRIDVQKGWRIKGQVQRILTIPASTLDLQQGYVRGLPFPKQNLRVIAHVALSGIMVSCPKNYGQAVARRVPGERNEWILEVTLAPDVPASSFEFKIELQPYDLERRSLPAAQVQVIGRVHQDVNPIPESIVLGDQSIGQTTVETIALRSFSGKAFRVQSIRLSSHTLKIEPLSQDRDGYVTESLFRLAATCSKERDERRFVEFVVRTQAGEEQTATVTVDSFGVQKTADR